MTLCEFTLFDDTAYQLPGILLYIRICLYKKQSDMYDILYVTTHLAKVNTMVNIIVIFICYKICMPTCYIYITQTCYIEHFY